MLHLKWGRHAETSSEVGLGGPDPPTADSLWHPGSIGDPVPRLWAPMTLYLLVTCWAALRFREKNGWEGVLQTERHFWILWTTPSRVLNPRVVVASEKQGQQHPKPNTWEADSQVQVHSENFRCSQGRWRRLLHKIPFEIFIGSGQDPTISLIGFTSCFCYPGIYPPCSARGLSEWNTAAFYSRHPVWFLMERTWLVLMQFFFYLSAFRWCHAFQITTQHFILQKNAFQTFLRDLF